MPTRVHPADGGVDTDLLTMTEVPDNACVFYDEKCMNEVPGRGQICEDCLDRVRHDES